MLLPGKAAAIAQRNHDGSDGRVARFVGEAPQGVETWLHLGRRDRVAQRNRRLNNCAALTGIGGILGKAGERE